MNSHRDNVKDALAGILNEWLHNAKDLNEFVPEIADAVFDALGITEDEQDLCSGYFLLHAGLRTTPEDAKRLRKIGNCEGLVPDEAGEFSTPLLTSGAQRECDNHNAIFGVTVGERKRQLGLGAKYTAGEFKGYCKTKWVEDGMVINNGVRITLETPICTYSQFYSSSILEEDARTNFVTFYYPMYLEDYERANEVEDWAEVRQSGRKEDLAENQMD